MTTESFSAQRDPAARGPDLEELFREVLQQLRGALLAALRAAGVDPIRPRHAARTLGIDKTLMWRVSRVVGQPDVFGILTHLPHQAGFAILCKALARGGVAEAQVGRVREALAAFEDLVARHAGDRATLELLAASFARAESQSQSLEQGRKLAYRGNSAVWGAQARLQLATGILLPGVTDPARIDLIQIFGFVDLRRLRGDVPWTLSHRQVFDDAYRNVRAAAGTPLDEGEAGSALIRAFSSRELPELQVEDMGDEQRHVLPAGKVGRTGDLTVLFGYRHAGIGTRHASETDQFGQVVTSLRTPVEQLQFDLIVHEELDWAFDPHLSILGTLDGRPGRLGDPRDGASPLFTETVTDLGRGLARASSQHMPEYGALLRWAFGRIDADPEAFRTFRFSMAFPPMPARAIFYSELPLAEEEPGRPGADGRDARDD